MQVAHSQTCISINSVSFFLRPQWGALFIVKQQDVKAWPQYILVSKEKSRTHRNLSCSAYPVQSFTPLTKAEEFECFADVQDLIVLEKKKVEIEGKLGRDPSYQEWADHVGCSLCRLYARIGKARAAKRKMIAANLPLVSSIAKEFHGRGLTHRELCQEGAKGLLKSTEKFDISHNTKFSTYSYFWIRERMSAAVQKFQSIWMAGRSLQRKLWFVLRCRDGIWQDELKAEFQVLFHALSPRESQVLRMRYGLYEGKPLSLFQIAGLLKLTHETVRKAERSAFEKVRKSATETGLQHYLSRISN